MAKQRSPLLPMDKFKRSLFRLGWLILAFVIISTILGFLGVVEISNGNLSEDLFAIKAAMVFIAMILICLRIFAEQDTMFVSALKIFTTLLVSGVATWLFSLSLFLNICSWSGDKILFQHKKHRSVTICTREFGCGAVDSSPPVYATRKSIEITPLITLYLPIDTNSIDRENWIRAE